MMRDEEMMRDERCELTCDVIIIMRALKESAMLRHVYYAVYIYYERYYEH